MYNVCLWLAGEEEVGGDINGKHLNATLNPQRTRHTRRLVASDSQLANLK